MFQLLIFQASSRELNRRLKVYNDWKTRNRENYLAIKSEKSTKHQRTNEKTEKETKYQVIIILTVYLTITNKTLIKF